MTTPPDETFRHALRRADVGRLSRLVDPVACPPGELAALIGHQDPRLRHLGLVLLAERVTTAPPAGVRERAELARLLPACVAAPPEAALVHAELHRQLGFRPGEARPDWRAARLPARVRTAWLRAELLHEPGVLRHEPHGELLYQAVREMSITEASRPGQVVTELVADGDPVVRSEALRLAREGLGAGLLAPSLVRAELITLLGADSAEVVAAALDGLAEPWAVPARQDSVLTAPRLLPFLTPASAAARPRVADAALTTAAQHGHNDVLRHVVAEPQLPPRLRRRAMELLGETAQRADIGDLTATASEDPLLFGRSGRDLPARPAPAWTLPRRRRRPRRHRPRARRSLDPGTGHRDSPLHLPPGDVPGTDRPAGRRPGSAAAHHPARRPRRTRRRRAADRRRRHPAAAPGTHAVAPARRHPDAAPRGRRGSRPPVPGDAARSRPGDARGHRRGPDGDGTRRRARTGGRVGPRPGRRGGRGHRRAAPARRTPPGPGSAVASDP